jgi:hypothetical protein
MKLVPASKTKGLRDMVFQIGDKAISLDRQKYRIVKASGWVWTTSEDRVQVYLLVDENNRQETCVVANEDGLLNPGIRPVKYGFAMAYVSV